MNRKLAIKLEQKFIILQELEFPPNILNMSIIVIVMSITLLQIESLYRNV